ncbi:hypothetical protein KIW84_063121 [Lathyrus oleraceus]|uniref:RRM domain-containing protein n=1 Tax=Pisum sativum TaxID=3888 RepID=A0A9D4W985_PEA|nr:hypothetical protein KIW84_063121 [Pisum sativum]
MAAINEIKKPKVHLAVFSTDKRVITGIQNLAEGFNHEVSFFSSIPQNHTDFLGFQFIVMDGFMAEFDRYEFVKSVTKEANLPVVVLCDPTVKGYELRNVNALRNGAISYWLLPVGPDDYMQIEPIRKGKASGSTTIRRRRWAKKMYEICREFGDIDEVVIQAKKDKHGKRYDFVRFFNVENENFLVAKLNNIFIGNRKILATYLGFRGEALEDFNMHKR